MTQLEYGKVDRNRGKTKSESIKRGLARNAMDPNSALFSKKCYGYKVTEKGLEPDPKEAEIVEWIFDAYLVGAGSHAIKKALEFKGIPSPTGKKFWSKRTIEKILNNEKYCGDVVFYKTYMEESIPGKRIENDGQHEKLVLKDHHPAIISRAEFELVQEMKQRRSRNAGVSEGPF